MALPPFAVRLNVNGGNTTLCRDRHIDDLASVLHLWNLDSLLHLLNHRHLSLQHHRHTLDGLLGDLRGFSVRHVSVLSRLALGLNCGQLCEASVVVAHRRVVGHLRLSCDG